MSYAENKAEGFAWMMQHANRSDPKQREQIERERDGWLRLDPLYIGDLIPGYQRPRAPADKMIATAIEQAMREAKGPFE